MHQRVNRKQQLADNREQAARSPQHAHGAIRVARWATRCRRLQALWSGFDLEGPFVAGEWDAAGVENLAKDEVGARRRLGWNSHPTEARLLDLEDRQQAVRLQLRDHLLL